MRCFGATTQKLLIWAGFGSLCYPKQLLAEHLPLPRHNSPLRVELQGCPFFTKIQFELCGSVLISPNGVVSEVFAKSC